MPSFLNDEKPPVFPSTHGIVHLNHTGQFGLSSDKTDGRLPFSVPSSQLFNASFEEGSSIRSTASSTNSDLGRPLDTGEISRSPSMTTLPTGLSGTDSNSLGRSESFKEMDQPHDKPMLTMVDRMARTHLASAGANTSGSTGEAVATDGHDSLQVKMRMPAAQTTSDGDRMLSQRKSGDAIASPPTLDSCHDTPSTSSPLPAASLPLGTSHASDYTERGQSLPQPPSSPLHQMPTLHAPSGSLGHQPSPSTGLKARHTLEVPKLVPARGSRDGSEGAFSSGRFSPTTAATGRRASLSLARRNTRSLQSDPPRDEIVPDEDALRWAEAYRQKRASKRKRREIEDDDRVLVGTKVDETHANWATAYNMLTGIRVSVSRTNAKLDRPLTDADFNTRQKSTFDVAGNELVPSAKYDFKFKDYAPWVFRHLRALFRLDPADYLMSLTGKYILSELGSPGKSGSFFYFSRDYKYIIKTIHHGEHKFLRKILRDYYQHVTDNPNTLLSQFYGLHRVKMPYGKKIHFVVMNNLFPPHRDIHQTFDLKGSTIGRDYKEDESTNPRATLKDLNWLRRQRHLELGLHKKQLFLQQLQEDVRLLQRLHIMDYSLLVGIHDLRKGNEENLRDKTLRVFNPGGDVHEDFDPHSLLMRTPSKLENQRKARELRQMIKAERPVPMGETSSRMPDELESGKRLGFVFNQDDGGFSASHEDNTPGEEVYYLGVIDCLTHYGIIKKLEHFWKGLSSDRTQISALPPHDYGERFINFISGVTMSTEEAQREAQARDAALAAEAAESEAHPVRTSDSAPGRHPSVNDSTPSANHNSLMRPYPSGLKSPEVDATLQKAQLEAQKTERQGASEAHIPEKILRATSITPQLDGAAIRRLQAGSLQGSDRKESNMTQATILPIVEEAAEGTFLRDRSKVDHITNSTTSDDWRPLTPAKDGVRSQSGFGVSSIHRNGVVIKGKVPPTPPQSATHTTLLKPESADSGYAMVDTNGPEACGVKSATASLKSLALRPVISRESLDKELPPLPTGEAVVTASGA